MSAVTKSRGVRYLLRSNLEPNLALAQSHISVTCEHDKDCIVARFILLLEKGPNLLTLPCTKGIMAMQWEHQGLWPLQVRLGPSHHQHTPILKLLALGFHQTGLK